MSKVPTAEEFLAKIDTDIYADGPVSSESGYSYKSVHKMLKVFAKIHVKAALLKASKAHLSIDMDEYAFDKMGEKILTEEAEEYNVNSILESYPLTNIK